MDRKKGTKKPKRALKKIAKPIKKIQPKKTIKVSAAKKPDVSRLREFLTHLVFSVELYIAENFVRKKYLKSSIEIGVSIV
jgi:hypothetical protein